MSGNLVLVQRFIPPDKGCDRKTFKDYVIKTIANEVTCDELTELCRFFAPCSCEDIVERVVEHFVGKNPRRKEKVS